MKFKLTSAKSFYTEEQVEKLRPLGFQFKNMTRWKSKDYEKVKEGDDIEINSMEELLKFIGEHGQVVVDQDSVLIYDWHIE